MKATFTICVKWLSISSKTSERHTGMPQPIHTVASIRAIEALTLPGAVPPVLLAGPGTGPALYLGASSNDPPVGYLSPDTSFEVAGTLGGDRVAVRINGPMTVEGLFFTSNRLAARVLRGGRVRGTPVSVGVGNVVRVLFRIHGVDRPADDARGVDWAWEESKRMVALAPPAQLNEGLMELGATVCTPSNPNCEECPVQRWCKAHAAGTQNQIPGVKGAARKRERIHCSQ